MKTTTRCRCCGDQTKELSKRWDEHHGLVCTECHTAMNGHLGIWAMGLIEGVIEPEPIKQKEGQS